MIYLMQYFFFFEEFVHLYLIILNFIVWDTSEKVVLFSQQLMTYVVLSQLFQARVIIVN